MKGSDAALRSKFLNAGFSGKLLDAQCSSESDRANILEEVLQSGKVAEVEEVVKVLLNMKLGCRN